MIDSIEGARHFIRRAIGPPRSRQLDSCLSPLVSIQISGSLRPSDSPVRAGGGRHWPAHLQIKLFHFWPSSGGICARKTRVSSAFNWLRRILFLWRPGGEPPTRRLRPVSVRRAPGELHLRRLAASGVKTLPGGAASARPKVSGRHDQVDRVSSVVAARRLADSRSWRSKRAVASNCRRRRPEQSAWKCGRRARS